MPALNYFSVYCVWQPFTSFSLLHFLQTRARLEVEIVVAVEENEMASPSTLLKHGHKSGNPQSSSCGTSKLLSSGGGEKSSYGTFLGTEESSPLMSSYSSLLSCRKPENKATSGLAFINISYQVPQTLGWLPGNSKTILKPARYFIGEAIAILSLCLYIPPYPHTNTGYVVV